MCSSSVLKTAQDACQFVFAVLAPFSLIKIHLLGVELDTFRTLKVHFDSAFQGLCLPLRVWGTCFHFQGWRQHRTLANFYFCGYGPFRFKMHFLGVELDPFRTQTVHFDSVFSHSEFGVNMCSVSVQKTGQDAGQFLFWPLFVSKCTFYVSNLTHVRPQRCSVQ